MYHVEGAVLTIGFLALFLFLTGRWKFFRFEEIPVKWFQAVFVLKVFSGFCLYLIYTYYYTDRSTADIWKYFDDGMVMYSVLSESPIDYLKMLIGVGNNTPHFDRYYDTMNHWYRPYGTAVANDTHTIIRFNAFVRLFSLGHYNVHSVMANFFGLVGLTGILHFLRLLNTRKSKWFFAGVMLMPGVLFWVSGVLKEPLLICGIGLFLHSLVELLESRFSFKLMMVLIVSLFFLATVKSYALVALIITVVGLVLAKRFKSLHPFVWFSLALVVGVLSAIVLHKTCPNTSIFKRIAQQQYEFYQLAEGGTYVKTAANDTLYIGAENYEALSFDSNRKMLTVKHKVNAVYWKFAKQESVARIAVNPDEEFEVLLDYGKTGSTINIPCLEPNFESILKASPVAFLNATFRPYPWEVRSPFMALSGIENIIILILLVLMVLKFQSQSLAHPIWYVAIVFAFIILILTGLVTPVIGAIVRYKVPALPFLVCSIIALTNTEQIEQAIVNRYPRIKNYF